MKSTQYFRFLTLHLILLFILRIVFYFMFRPQEEFSLHLLWQAFKLGSRFDLRFCCILLMPLVILGWGSWSPLASRKAEKRWSLFYAFLGGLWITFYIFDFGFYGYLNSRMNSSALLFLENPDISFGMLWQSYPVVLITFAFLVVMAIYYHLLQRFVFRPFANFFSLPSRILSLLFFVTFMGGLYGQFSQYPLRWSEAFFSPRHFISHLSLNPVLYFFESYEFPSQKSYDIEKVRKAYPLVAEYLGVEKQDSEKLTFTRKVLPVNSIEKPKNVILIVMESLAFSKTSLANNVLNPTPSVAELAKQSLWFSNYFSPSEGTARNMFSIMTATPDVTQVQTSTRNPLVVDQKIIANAFKNYQKMYFLGGSASWANIRGIFSHNIDDIEIYEEGSFAKERTDVWGVSDLDLFIEAHERFANKDRKKPFFAVIQTASFHRPYTIPANAKKFKNLKVPLTQLKEAGFYSLEQFNSLRFSDYSLGYFMELAKKSPYYKDTIFVITGDHGLPDEGGMNVPEGMHLWELEKYHVPLLIHTTSPVIKPQEDQRMAGHPDVMTSVASLAGVPHENTTLGRNLFDQKLDKERYSFVFNYYSELNEFGLLSNEFYYHYDDKNKAQLFQYKSEHPHEDVQKQFPDVFSRMSQLGQGYLETARYLLFNNPKEPRK